MENPQMINRFIFVLMSVYGIVVISLSIVFLDFYILIDCFVPVVLFGGICLGICLGISLLYAAIFMPIFWLMSRFEPKRDVDTTRADFRIVENINAVYDDWDPNLAIDIGCAVVDVQLIQGDLLQDRLFITDFSQAIPRKKSHYRYSTLENRVKSDEIVKIRRFIKDVLTALAAPKHNFVLFGSGGNFSQNKAQDIALDEHYLITAFCDNMHINGSLLIFEVTQDEIDQYAEAFCAGDLVRGVAIEAGRIKEVLSRLSLAEPIPTTQRYSRFRMIKGADNPKPLKNLLEIASFFFEEIDNGTRLRLVSRSIPREQIIATVERVIEPANRPCSE